MCTIYIGGVVTLVRGQECEVTLVVVAVDGALRARVPLQAAVRGPPPGVALYLADEDVPVLGEGGAGPGEGQRVARVLREVNSIILRFVCWFTARARNEPSRSLKLHKHRAQRRPLLVP